MKKDKNYYSKKMDYGSLILDKMLKKIKTLKNPQKYWKAIGRIECMYRSMSTTLHARVEAGLPPRFYMSSWNELFESEENRLSHLDSLMKEMYINVRKCEKLLKI